MQTRSSDSAVSSGPEFLNQNETMPVDACVVRFVDGDSISPASIGQNKKSADSKSADFLHLSASMQLQISPEIQISYDNVGAGQPLVLLHAFPLYHEMWRNQIREFAPDYQIIAPDARGFGESTAFDDLGIDEKPSLEIVARDVNALLDELNVTQPIILCGLSMGGYTALEFARQFPQRLAGLILCDTRADAESDEAKKSRDEMIEFARHHNGEEVAEKMLPKLLGATTRAHNLAVAARVRELAMDLTGHNAAAMLMALRNRRDSTGLLGEIKVPTLVVGGAQDEICPPEIMGAMAAQIHGARHETIRDAGHLSNLEAPESFNAVLREWLSENYE